MKRTDVPHCTVVYWLVNYYKGIQKPDWSHTSSLFKNRIPTISPPRPSLSLSKGSDHNNEGATAKTFGIVAKLQFYSFKHCTISSFMSLIFCASVDS